MSSGISFSPDAIRALAQILRETDLSEIELADKDSRVRVTRNVTVAPVMTVAAPAAVAAAPAPIPAPLAAA
ncbi:acetyl-CoA carboxylase biotin carboxyl carrier protein, partial [Roseomonas sp. GC11]|nr:acetyl-CoA carboxylase biotin carboxyl carrier protein [Roseomonas sp. GC11]